MYHASSRFAAIVALLSLFAPFSSVYAESFDENAYIEAGDLVRCANFPAVYYIGEDGKRHAFPNERIYFSWYPDYSGVKKVSCDDISDFVVGQNVRYQSGRTLVKIPSVNTVYAVGSQGDLYSIASESIASALYGGDWAKKVHDLPEAFWSNYTVVGALDGTDLPDGTVFLDAS